MNEAKLREFQLFLEDYYVELVSTLSSRLNFIDIRHKVALTLRTFLKGFLQKSKSIDFNKLDSKSLEYLKVILEFLKVKPAIIYEKYSEKLKLDVYSNLLSSSLRGIYTELISSLLFDSAKEFRTLTERIFGPSVVWFPSFKAIRENFKVFYTTTTLGNLSFKYGGREHVQENRKMLLKIISAGEEKFGSFILFSLKSRDDLLELDMRSFPNVLSKNKYSFLAATPDFLRELGLDKDAVVSFNIRQMAAGMLVGDCYVVVLFIPSKKLLAMVHVGVPGVSLDILGKTMERLKIRFGVFPTEIYAFIGPGILKYNYFYEDVSKLEHVRFWDGHIKQVPGKGYQIDLFGALRHRLLVLGIPFENYIVTPRDTYSDKYLWSHYRAYHEKENEGRFLVGIEFLEV